jgi:hypothetical protein
MNRRTGNLGSSKERKCFNHQSMKRDIRPATYCVDWGILPCLKPTSMYEVVRWLPVVVDCDQLCRTCKVPSSQSPIIEYCAASKRGTSRSEKIKSGGIVRSLLLSECLSLSTIPFPFKLAIVMVENNFCKL